MQYNVGALDSQQLFDRDANPANNIKESDISTQTKHTPAPWQVTKHEDCDASIITAGHESIAFVYIDDNEKPATENNRADARLIAAAPDLLEALRIVVDACPACRSEAPHDCTAVGHRLARAAIAKAEGR